MSPQVRVILNQKYSFIFDVIYYYLVIVLKLFKKNKNKLQIKLLADGPRHWDRL